MSIFSDTQKRKPPQFQLEKAHGASVLEQQRLKLFQCAVNQFSRLTGNGRIF